jgi:8-oxo-dGTP diphosphatase
LEVTRIGAYGIVLERNVLERNVLERNVLEGNVLENIVLEKNRILLCRLSAQVTGFTGNWTLPGGGIEFGEQPEEAMIREVAEETGLCVVSDGVVNAHSLQREFDGRSMHSIRIVYRTRIMGGELCFEQDGTTDRCEWFTESEARALPLVELAKLGIDLAFL